MHNFITLAALSRVAGGPGFAACASLSRPLPRVLSDITLVNCRPTKVTFYFFSTVVAHDDFIVATATKEEHGLVVDLVMQAIESSGLTLNLAKCVFGCSGIRFWGIIVGCDGVRPDPA